MARGHVFERIHGLRRRLDEVLNRGPFRTLRPFLFKRLVITPSSRIFLVCAVPFIDHCVFPIRTIGIGSRELTHRPQPGFTCLLPLRFIHSYPLNALCRSGSRWITNMEANSYGETLSGVDESLFAILILTRPPSRTGERRPLLMLAVRRVKSRRLQTMKGKTRLGL